VDSNPELPPLISLRQETLPVLQSMATMFVPHERLASPASVELEGLDVPEMGALAYPDFPRRNRNDLAW
jgi:hypothetical protein